MRLRSAAARRVFGIFAPGLVDKDLSYDKPDKVTKQQDAEPMLEYQRIGIYFAPNTQE